MLEFRFIYGYDGYELSKDMRKTVFGEKRKINDDFEEKSYHFIGYDKTVQIAVARLTGISEGCCKIAYVAVKDGYRREYVGDLVMRALADKAVTLGAKSVILESPEDVKGFFEAEGYAAIQQIDSSEGTVYIMKKDLTKVEHCRGCAR